jgi:hypothetical protein
MDENQMTSNYHSSSRSDAQTTGKSCYRFCTVIAQKIDSQSPAYSRSGFPPMSAASAISIDSLVPPKLSRRGDLDRPSRSFAQLDCRRLRSRPLAKRDDRRLTVSALHRRRCRSRMASYARLDTRRRDFHRSLRELPDR